MYHRDPYDVPPSASSVMQSSYYQNVPSAEDYRPRSQSADTRRTGFNQRRPFSEEHHDDPYPIVPQYPPSIHDARAAYLQDTAIQAARYEKSAPRNFNPAQSDHAARYEDYANSELKKYNNSVSTDPIKYSEFIAQQARNPAFRSPSAFEPARYPGASRLDPSDGLRSSTVEFPSSLRVSGNGERRLSPPTGAFQSTITASGAGSVAASPQFNSSAHHLTQLLRERSPSSSSALLNLLSRYPSARHHVHPKVFGVVDRPTHTVPLRPADAAANYPLVELSVPDNNNLFKPIPTHRTHSLPANDFNQNPHHNLLTSSFHSEYRSSPVGARFNDLPAPAPPERHNDPRDLRSYQERQQLQNHHQHQEPTTATNTQWPSDNNRFGQNNDRQSTNNNKPLSPSDVEAWERLLDVTQLDSLLASVLEDNMNRSTSEWRNSFAQMQNRFSEAPEEVHQQQQQQPSRYVFTSSGASTLPREVPSLSKSASSHDFNSNSILNKAVDRRAAEAPEVRKSGALDNFWKTTVSNRPSSPTIARLPNNLTAAERLQMLQEPINKEKRSVTPSVPPRVGSGSALAARREHYLQEASSNVVNVPVIRESSRPSSSAAGFTSPNFSDLDSAVMELSGGGVRSTGYSQGARRLGGCARFPTDEHAFSPPPRIVNVPISRKFQSPSPTDDLSESSSIYQIPTGLPHPKPKHNIKEQLYQAGVRAGVRVSPNFPVPSTGSVASRITEFEKRPGTPTLQIAGPAGRDRSPTPTIAGPMSPRSTVFRTKPVIHMDSHSPKLGSTTTSEFIFPLNGKNVSYTGTPPSSARDQPVNNYNHVNGSASVSTPLRDQHTPLIDKSSTSLNGYDDKRRVNGGLQFDLDSSTSSGSSDSSSLNCRRAAQKSYVNHTLEKSGNLHSPQNSDISSLSSPSVSINNSYNVPPIINRAAIRRVVNVPEFYFPQGKPTSNKENDAALRRVAEVFRVLQDQKCSLSDMPEVCLAAGLPIYWKAPIFYALTKYSSGPKEDRLATQADFSAWWRRMTSVAHDAPARFIYCMTDGARHYVTADDLHPMIMDIIHSHPGLAFYREATEFHDKYCEVIATRILWNAGRIWVGKITAQDLRRKSSDLLEKIIELQQEDDINKSLRYFSYEHFYVVYCKFWELDTDHDLKINLDDFLYYNDGVIPMKVAERIFSGAVKTETMKQQKNMTLGQFTQFLLADEDKTHPTSIEYWFRIVDLDGDGMVTQHEAETLHTAIQHKLEDEKIDTMNFKDVLCQLIDMINPTNENYFTLSDLKKSPLSKRFLNCLVNWRKFYIQETNEGSDNARVEDESGQEMSDWDRFCAEEYEVMMANEDGEDNVDENINLYLEDDESL